MTNKYANNYRESQYTLTSTASVVAVQRQSRTGIILFNTGSQAATFSIGTLYSYCRRRSHCVLKLSTYESNKR